MSDQSSADDVEIKQFEKAWALFETQACISNPAKSSKERIKSGQGVVVIPLTPRTVHTFARRLLFRGCGIDPNMALAIELVKVRLEQRATAFP